MNSTTISILLPVRNEQKTIESCLDRIYQQKGLDDGFEVIVADGMSTDKTPDIVRTFQSDHPNLILIENPGKIVPTGLNLAIQRSSGEIIVRIDGHTTIALDYIQQCVMALRRTGAENVGGRMDAIGTTWFGEAVAAATSTPFGVGGSRFHFSEKEEYVDSVYMGAWPRRVFEKTGLFDEEMVRDQDDEFNYRLRAQGGKILLSPKIKSKYTVRSIPLTLWKQYFQYGFWKVRVFQKHPGQMSYRHFIPPLFVLSLIFLGVLSFVSGYFGLLFIVLGVSYLVTNLLASFYTVYRQDWKFLFVIPFIFAILHLSYGSGFLLGLAHFWNRWNDKKGRVIELEKANV